MMTEKETVRLSKFLSLVLRHQPQTVGLTLDEAGWTRVVELLAKLNENGFNIGIEELKHTVATNNKQRFAFNDDETKIRASQGHSVDVELGYEEAVPPAVLYHGTAQKNVEAILSQGLVRQSRHHVHLSLDKETAVAVGQRHGKPVVWQVSALKMHEGGQRFYRSANGVWLAEGVSPAYLRLMNE